MVKEDLKDYSLQDLRDNNISSLFIDWSASAFAFCLVGLLSLALGLELICIFIGLHSGLGYIYRIIQSRLKNTYKC